MDSEAEYKDALYCCAEKHSKKLIRSVLGSIEDFREAQHVNFGKLERLISKKDSEIVKVIALMSDQEYIMVRKRILDVVNEFLRNLDNDLEDLS